MDAPGMSQEEIRQDTFHQLHLPRLSSAARLMSLGQFKNTRGANYHTTPEESNLEHG